ncbi:outer membrane protein [Duganella sp. SG902]|uniref:MipA/OmpV family protein n=1 Tax=Duganella sp. SG902 TaxID=2587016 RepID=UPI00159D1FA0|nr:MipA/OmpV family protein [Duganella sp. SG902]NVM77523.1 outer membrane protein [Duganella sp. SG902]
MTRSSPARALLAILIGIPALPAHAGDANTDQPPRAAIDSLLGSKTEVTVGVALSAATRYPGADTGSVLRPIPVLSIQRGVLFADTTRGAGLQYQSSTGFYISQSFSYDRGRLERNSGWRPGSSRLAGMGDVPGSPTARTLIAQQLQPWLTASAEMELALRDDARRNRYRTGVELVPLRSAADIIAVDIDAWWGDGRYNQAYFGVTPAQAAQTRFAVAHPGSGMYVRSAGLSWEHHLDAHWSSTLQLTITRYVGDVSDSPVVARRTSAGATAAITYSY